MKSTRVLVIALLTGTQTGFSQGTFQDLNFEEANPGAGSSAPNLFPGWQVFYGSTQGSVVGYDTVSTGGALISIQDDKYGYVPIQGNYTAFLQSASIGVPLESISVALSQTGIVPTGTESIQLDASEANDGSFVVALGGDTISMVPLQTISGYTLYGGNISAWAGKDATLSITQLAPPTANGEYSPSLLELDDINFSPIGVVPEPDPLVLMGMGAALVAAYRRLMENRKVESRKKKCSM